jgi:hypothetical protein
MDHKRAKTLAFSAAPNVVVLPYDASMQRLFAIRLPDKALVFSIQLPEGEDELAEANFLMMFHHGRGYLLNNGQVGWLTMS